MLRPLLLLLLSLTCAFGQDVRITEFLPVNTTGLLDQDGTPQPWIEVWNPNPTSKVTLTNWALLHEGTTWTFPAGFEIPPGEFVVIFASGKDRKVLTAPLHTNFTLKGAGGGPLSLRRGDTTIASTFATYPALAANVSYGRDIAENAQIGFYADPSPEEANNYTGAGVSGKVVISAPSQAFQGTLNVTLTQATPVAGAKIRYTTTGGVPLSTSPEYTGTPISIAAAQPQLRARVFEPGKLPGEIESEAYLLVNATTFAFNSAAPIVVVSTFGATIPDAGDQPSFMWIWEPGTDGRARISNLPTLVTRSVVDRRGSSTLGNPKTNFNLEARKGRDDDDRDVEVLGMPAGSDWVFHAPYEFDKSLVHNPFAYELSNSINRTAMRTRMAEVFVKVTGNTIPLSFTGSASGDYFGLYNVMEKIRRGNDRVEVTKLGMYDNDPIGKTGGYITKIDRRDAGDTGFDAGGLTDGSLGLCYYYPKEVEIKAPQRSPQVQYLTQYYNSTKAALDSVNFKDPVTGYAAWIDVPAAIDHHLLNVWTFNVDAFRLSGFMTKERNEKLVFGPIWDFDRALSSTDGRDSNPATWRAQTGDLGTDFFNFKWWNRLFNDPDFYQKYIDRWLELRQDAFAPATVNALLDSLNASLTGEGVNRDLARWNRAKRAWNSPFPPFTAYPASQAAEIQRIKDWLQQRANFFDSQWVTPVTLNHTGGTVTPGFEVTMTAAAGSTIYYTLDGTDPRPSGGAAPTGANVFTYSGPITINSLTRIKARAYNASFVPSQAPGPNNPPLISKWSGLRDARYNTDPPATPATLAITEINYHPADPTEAELAINPALDTSDFEFIELKNVGATPIDLAGVKLVIGAEFTINNDIAFTLPPGGFVILSANPAAFAVRYTNVSNVLGPFRGDLSNSGEEIVIEALDKAKIVSFIYDDAWHPASDGDGPTMETKSQTPSNYQSPATWKASLRNGGTPGYDYELAITQHPVGVAVNPGQPVNLEVQTTGNPAPTFQWRKGGDPIPGQTAATLSILSATEANQGNYDVVVTNVGGDLISNVAFVSVHDPVAIVSHPEAQTVNPDEIAIFSVSVTGTSPTFQWRKGGVPIDGATESDLILAGAEADEGSYDVVVTNMVNSVTSNAAALIVNDPVLITDSPDTQAVNPGGTVTLTVVATGADPLSYQWRKGGDPINGANAASYQIGSAGKSDEGTYDVVVSNAFSSKTSDGAILTVNDGVIITEHPLPQGMAPGGSASFSVSATGTGPFTYQWQKNGVPIDGATNATYEIAAVNDTHIGNYTVVVTNVVGSATSNTAALSFVDWVAAAGIYQGLLVGSDLNDPESDPYPGRVTATLAKSGKVTGNLEYLGLKHPFSIKLDVNLRGSVTISRKSTSPVKLDVHLDSVNSALELKANHQGENPLFESNGEAPKIPKRPKTVPAARAGRYTLLLLPGAGAPLDLTAPGYLTLNIAKSGNATWLGKLADTTVVKGSALLTPSDQLAFHTMLYPRKFPLAGYVGGPIAVEAATTSGDFVWRKPAQGKGFWPGGLTTLLTADGRPYAAPAKNVRVIPHETLALQLDGPVPNGEFEQTLQLSLQNKFIAPPPNVEKVKLTLNRTTGQMKGSYFDTTLRATRKLEGVILQSDEMAGGFFPGGVEVGTWSLTVPVTP